MSETDRNTDSNPDGKGGAADADLNKLKSQIDDLKKGLEGYEREKAEWVADRTKLKEEIKTLRANQRKESDDKAAEEKDIEKLRASFNEQMGERDKEIASLKESLHTNVLKSGVIRELQGLVKDPEWVFENMKGGFELKDDGKGNLSPRVKDSVQDVKSFVEKTLTESKREYLLLSGRQSGTGQTQPETNGKSGAKYTFEQLNSMDPASYAKVVKSDPEAARIYSEGLTRR